MISLHAESEFWKQRINKEETAEKISTLWPVYKESLFSESAKKDALKKLDDKKKQHWSCNGIAM